MLIWIFKKICLADNHEVDDIIKQQLLENYDFWTYILYKLNIYDEKNDSIKYILALKVLFLYIEIFKIAINI